MSAIVLSADTIRDLCDLMDRKHSMYLGDRSFSIEASIDVDIVDVKITLANSEHSFYYPVESRIHFKDEEMKPEIAAKFLVDYIDLYFCEYFDEDEALFIPIDWAKFEYDAVVFEMRGQILNKKLEDLADAILEKADVQIELQ